MVLFGSPVPIWEHKFSPKKTFPDEMESNSHQSRSILSTSLWLGTLNFYRTSFEPGTLEPQKRGESLYFFFFSFFDCMNYSDIFPVRPHPAEICQKFLFQWKKWWRSSVARRYSFKPKFQIWVNFGRSCNQRCRYVFLGPVYLTDNWYILWQLGSFCGRLVYFFPFWYVVPR
jgi:hypothetical protein